MNTLQTPLEKLISDKKRIQEQCRIQEQMLNEDVTYIHDNAGSLLLSSLSSLFFPGTNKTNAPTTSTSVAATASQPIISLGMADYLSVAKGLMPMAWNVAKPLLISWGIQKAQTWFINTLFRKKK
ncbi:MAG: hypothetical protein RR382_11385 [Tannerellaceae bacterium]